jgi:hypothetical protein
METTAKFCAGNPNESTDPVCISIAPILQFLPGLPLSRAPKLMGTPNPILLEKKGRIVAYPKFAKRSPFSKKNCRFSGKNSS